MSALQTTSPWFESTPDKRRFPQLSGTSTVDVAIVGAGVAGVLTAYRLAEHGAHVALLEQNHIATGDTGYTTAFATRIPDSDLPALAKRYGDQYVPDLLAAAGRAQDWLRTTLREQHVECGWRDCWSYHCTYRTNDQALAAEWTVVKAADKRASFVRGKDAAVANPAAAEAIRFDGEARFDARAAYLGLLATPIGKKIAVHEESPVTDVVLDGAAAPVIVKTATGEVRAKTLVVATGMPLEPFSDLHRLLTPQVTYALTARYTTPLPISDDIFWDTDEPYQYYRRLSNDTLILGGADRRADESYDHPKGSPTPHEELEHFMAERLPGVNSVTRRWSGSIFSTVDGVPYAGQHPRHPNVLVVTGFGGNGMVMGALAAAVLSDLALGKPNAASTLLSFERTGRTLPPPPATAPQAIPAPQPTVTRRGTLITTLRILLPLSFAAALVAPAVAFFGNRGGTDFLAGADFQTFSILMFPLVGLYAFTLLWVQFMLGSTMYPLKAVFPRIELFHRTEGVFVLLFALTHPTLIMFGVGGLAEYFKTDFVPEALVPWVWVGEVQLTLLCLTVATALLRKTKWLRTRWHYVHYANYIVFGLAWLHSWNLGSDVQSSLAWLWYFFGVTALASAAARLYREIKNRRATRATPGATWTVAAAQRDVTADKPTCVVVNSKRLALFKVAGEVYAISNTCTHAGGPLCEGSLTAGSGGVVTCPWHGSRFDVKSGSVVGGPAQRAVRTYKTRLRNGNVEILA